MGGFFNVPHGLTNAILLPHIMDFNRMAAPEKFECIARLMGEAPLAENAVLANPRQEICDPQRLQPTRFVSSPFFLDLPAMMKPKVPYEKETFSCR